LNASDLIKKSNRIIIKIGSVLVTDSSTGKVNDVWLNDLSLSVSNLLKENKEVIIVTSGSIALGRKYLSLGNCKNKNDLKLSQKQAAASIGQIELINSYFNIFSKNDIKISQVLLSPSDTENRRNHLNARATLNTLLESNIVPIVNENDSVTTKEIRFGDNDRLAARVGQIVDADLIILLSTIDGLYSDDPNMNPNSVHIPLVKKLNNEYMSMGKDIKSGISTGGMKSKLQAADIAVNAGSNMIIANGVKEGSIEDLINNKIKSTIFLSTEKPIKARKKWIASHFEQQGNICIDEGALKALKEGKSLLPVGVVNVSGEFDRGDIVNIIDNGNNIIAVGISSYSSTDINKIKKIHSKDLEKILGYVGRDEIIHRSNLSLKI